MVLQAMQLAERLRDIKGENLDSDDYQAISEATGVSAEYLKFVEKSERETVKRGFLDEIREQYFALENDTRRLVLSGLFATFTSLLWKVGDKVDSITSIAGRQYGVFQTVAYIIMMAALYNAAVSKNHRAAVLAGLVFGMTSFLMGSIFSFVFFISNVQVSPPMILVWSAAAAFIGFLAHSVYAKYLQKNAKKGNTNARQDLLKRLVDLQEQLREGQQSVCFLSLDVVGSTKMKIGADPLAIEYTFNEYHKFVEKVAEKHSGRVHSTAGDGITVAFDHPQQAFNAAKQIQTGLIEFNALRNKIDQPLTLRAGIHAGEIVAPEAGNVTSVNFASVIDIAAHLQKEAPVGGIAVSDAAGAMIMGGPKAIGNDRVCAHDTWATIWSRKKSLDTFKLAEAPIVPGS